MPSKDVITKNIPHIEGEFWLPYEPVAKGRPRMGKWGAYTPKKTEDAEMYIRNWVAAHHTLHGQLPYPLSMDITFFCSATKAGYHVKRPDVDNFLKLLLDALGPNNQRPGLLYLDDAQVCDIHVRKLCHPIRGIWVKWSTLPDYTPVDHPMTRELTHAGTKKASLFA